MKLSVPFLPISSYVNFLKNCSDHIHSIYFSLNTGPVLDARFRFIDADIEQLNAKLTELKNIKKYCLLNARFVHPSLYHDDHFLDRLFNYLGFLKTTGNLDGFVFSDAYLLTAMGNKKNRLSESIEAVPGINCMIDSFEKAEAFFEIIRNNRFLTPGKIILDRSMNRDLGTLIKTADSIHERYPDIIIELLANEGCIRHCPFKLTHDAQISLANLDSVKNVTFITNQSVGCHAYFFDQPENFLKSPFIRPEDQAAYTPFVDTIKICGRTLGTKFLFQVIKAYINRSFDGNLIELMDAAHWLADHYNLRNKRLDPGFLKIITGCKNICTNCNHCSKLWSTAATKKKLQFKPYKDIR